MICGMLDQRGSNIRKDQKTVSQTQLFKHWQMRRLRLIRIYATTIKLNGLKQLLLTSKQGLQGQISYSFQKSFDCHSNTHELCLLAEEKKQKYTHETQPRVMPATAVNISRYFVVRDKEKSCGHTIVFFHPLRLDQWRVTEVVITPSKGPKDLRAGGQKTVGKTKEDHCECFPTIS